MQSTMPSWPRWVWAQLQVLVVVVVGALVGTGSGLVWALHLLVLGYGRAMSCRTTASCTWLAWGLRSLMTCSGCAPLEIVKLPVFSLGPGRGLAQHLLEPGYVLEMSCQMTASCTWLAWGLRSLTTCSGYAPVACAQQLLSPVEAELICLLASLR